MLIRRICAAVIVGLAMSAGAAGSSQADSDWWDDAPWWRAYNSGDQSSRHFTRGDVRCDRERDVCYDRYGLSYHATARYLGEKEANRAYKKYGNKVFLFSPQRGVVCDRRTETCSGKRWSANNNYGNSADRNTQARDGFGAIGSSNDWRYRQRQKQQYWPFDDD
ncbi:MAG TPA: hypothetical protein VJ790_15935 [Dongiaceae bacterium]|nr:hypothetical protein [Dongiaceae bacterium]